MTGVISREWVVVLVSALTDAALAFSAALMATMVEAGSGEMPSKGALIIASLGALTAGARTVQQALKGDALTPKPKGEHA